mgnify:CR=1 FL=1
MKIRDIYMLLFLAALFAPFVFSDTIFQWYDDFNKTHGLITSFVKFAVLATLGEAIGLRIRKGVYNQKGFGLVPRAVVWGFIGITIKIAFIIFATGTPAVLEYLGLKGAAASMNEGISGLKLLTAFSISTAMNLIFAPVFMTFHKITDNHIVNKGGTLKGFFTPIQFGQIIMNLDWSVQYHFVFKKTIPFFWIPAHTITFMLPPQYRVLFAAILGIVLGVILSIASLKSSN